MVFGGSARKKSHFCERHFKPYFNLTKNYNSMDPFLLKKYSEKIFFDHFLKKSEHSQIEKSLFQKNFLPAALFLLNYSLFFTQIVFWGQRAPKNVIFASVILSTSYFSEHFHKKSLFFVKNFLPAALF